MILSNPSFGTNRESKYKPLKGLKGVYVFVEKLPKEVVQNGLKEEDIKEEIEKRLRDAKIKVFSREEMLKTPGLPALYANFHFMSYSDSSPFYAVSFYLDLTHGALLYPQKSGPYIVTIWYAGATGFIEKKNVKHTNGYLQFIDKFINDYFSANRNE